MTWQVLAVFVAAGSVATAAAAQTLPSEPLSFADGRVVMGAEVAATIAPEDTGFFNYSAYEHSALRELRIAVGTNVRVNERVSILADVRSENFDRLAAFALYARVRPMPGRRLDIQIGRIPPVFGRFARQAYGRQNPLIGVPLAYQYLTSLRADAVPVDADELLRMRGRGWLSRFSVGNTEAAAGVPLVSFTHWDTGVQVSTGWKMLDVAAAVTNGTPSRPRITDDNDGKQVAARATLTPAPGFVFGASAARGQFLSRDVLADLPEGNHGRFAQQAYGLDAEYSRGHGQLRTEVVFSRWQMPLPAEPRAAEMLQALSAMVEGRYTVGPGAYLSARAEHLTFNRIAGSAGTERWEAPVTRLELGGGYALRRNVLAKAAVQLNWRDAGRVTRAHLIAGQLLYWF